MKSSAVRNRGRKLQSKFQYSVKQPIQVYCRVRPVLSEEESETCLKILPPCYINVCPPSNSNNVRNGLPVKEIQYTFKQVFGENSSQKDVFESVALPLVENALAGRNSLLFTYGVTGSGKTFTMTGSPQDGGIMPRCLDVIFNSISNCQARRRIFKPDKLNSFDIQSEADAQVDRDRDLAFKVASCKTPRRKNNSDPDLASRARDSSIVVNVDEDCCYAVFVNHVEIYNNSVFDLLEDFNEDLHKSKPPQPKIIREDADHNMYVHGVCEYEVCSTEEAFEIYYKGQKRKRVAQTTLNSESSRSHSVFTVRIVQAPLNSSGDSASCDKSSMIVSQLSLVDLAGSERTSRTNNTGQRLREAGNINNSLLTLRTCLELLRENQNGANKMIPYRDSRLTHLFKNYFDGDGHVSMIICASPLATDYEENLHVMKFAEMSQEVQVVVNTPAKSAPSGRRRANIAFHAALRLYDEQENGGRGGDADDALAGPLGINNWFGSLPDVRLLDMNNTEVLSSLKTGLHEALIPFQEFREGTLRSKMAHLRESILELEKNSFMASQEAVSCRNLLDREKDKTAAVENRAISAESQLMEMKRKLSEAESITKRLKIELTDKENKMKRLDKEKENVKEQFSSKIQENKEKFEKEIERKLKSQRYALERAMKSKENRLKAIVNCKPDEAVVLRHRPLESRSAESLASTDIGPPSESNKPDFRIATTAPATPTTSNQFTAPTPRSTCRKMGVPVANRRHRRSRSAGNDLWLEHRPVHEVPTGTLMQPTMNRRKSITKLTDAKDVTEKTSKYCLMTQSQDSDGDLETRLYKGDVIPTAGGGAQVMFNDVEVLRQMSPTTSPPRKRPAEIRQEIEEAITRSTEANKRRAIYRP